MAPRGSSTQKSEEHQQAISTVVATNVLCEKEEDGQGNNNDDDDEQRRRSRRREALVKKETKKCGSSRSLDGDYRNNKGHKDQKKKKKTADDLLDEVKSSPSLSELASSPDRRSCSKDKIKKESKHQALATPSDNEFGQPRQQMSDSAIDLEESEKRRRDGAVTADDRKRRATTDKKSVYKKSASTRDLVSSSSTILGCVDTANDDQTDTSDRNRHRRVSSEKKRRSDDPRLQKSSSVACLNSSSSNDNKDFVTAASDERKARMIMVANIRTTKAAATAQPKGSDQEPLAKLNTAARSVSVPDDFMFFPSKDHLLQEEWSIITEVGGEEWALTNRRKRLPFAKSVSVNDVYDDESRIDAAAWKVGPTTTPNDEATAEKRRGTSTRNGTWIEQSYKKSTSARTITKTTPVCADDDEKEATEKRHGSSTRDGSRREQSYKKSTSARTISKTTPVCADDDEKEANEKRRSSCTRDETRREQSYKSNTSTRIISKTTTVCADDDEKVATEKLRGTSTRDGTRREQLYKKSTSARTISKTTPVCVDDGEKEATEKRHGSSTTDGTRREQSYKKNTSTRTLSKTTTVCAVDDEKEATEKHRGSSSRDGKRREQSYKKSTSTRTISKKTQVSAGADEKEATEKHRGSSTRDATRREQSYKKSSSARTISNTTTVFAEDDDEKEATEKHRGSSTRDGTRREQSYKKSSSARTISNTVPVCADDDEKEATEKSRGTSTRDGTSREPLYKKGTSARNVATTTPVCAAADDDDDAATGKCLSKKKTRVAETRLDARQQLLQKSMSIACLISSSNDNARFENGTDAEEHRRHARKLAKIRKAAAEPKAMKVANDHFEKSMDGDVLVSPLKSNIPDAGISINSVRDNQQEEIGSHSPLDEQDSKPTSTISSRDYWSTLGVVAAKQTKADRTNRRVSEKCRDTRLQKSVSAVCLSECMEERHDDISEHKAIKMAKIRKKAAETEVTTAQQQPGESSSMENMHVVASDTASPEIADTGSLVNIGTPGNAADDQQENFVAMPVLRADEVYPTYRQTFKKSKSAIGYNFLVDAPESKKKIEPPTKMEFLEAHKHADDDNGDSLVGLSTLGNAADDQQGKCAAISVHTANQAYSAFRPTLKKSKSALGFNYLIDEPESKKKIFDLDKRTKQFEPPTKIDFVEAHKRLDDNDDSLVGLDLSGQVIGTVQLSALAMTLRGNWYLRELHLVNVGMRPEVGTQLAKCLIRNKTLQRLYLQTNNLGDVGTEALASAFYDNGTLQLLNLARNGIGDIGVAALAEALAANRHGLRKLYLYENKIDDLGAEALGELIMGTPSLQEVYVWDNVFGPVGLANLKLALQHRNSRSNPAPIHLRISWKGDML